jgi:citrate synthase
MSLSHTPITEQTPPNWRSRHGSTLSDFCSAITSAIGTLKGRSMVARMKISPDVGEIDGEDKVNAYIEKSCQQGNHGHQPQF